MLYQAAGIVSVQGDKPQGNARNECELHQDKLNVQNPIIKKFVEYYWKIIEEGSEEVIDYVDGKK